MIRRLKLVTSGEHHCPSTFSPTSFLLLLTDALASDPKVLGSTPHRLRRVPLPVAKLRAALLQERPVLA